MWRIFYESRPTLFASTRIIIAAPRQSLVDYYRDEFGYKLAKKRERKTTAMFKDVEVQ